MTKGQVEWYDDALRSLYEAIESLREYEDQYPHSRLRQLIDEIKVIHGEMEGTEVWED